VPQHLFVVVQLWAVFVFGFDDLMDVRVRLVSVEHHGVPYAPEYLPVEVAM